MTMQTLAGMMTLVWCLIALNVNGGEPAPRRPSSGSIGDTEIQLVLDLSDGSRIIGITPLRTLPLRSPAVGDIKIPIERIRSVKMDADIKTARVTLRNGDTLNGAVTLATVEITALFGKATVRLADLREMQVRSTAGGAPTDGLILHFSFNQEGEQIVDDSGKHVGTVLGATFEPHGKSGGCYRFSGAGQMIKIPNADDLNPGQQVSLTLWTKIDSDKWHEDRCQGIVTTDFYLIEICGPQVHLVVSTDGGQDFRHAPADGGGIRFALDEWHHVAGVYDGTNALVLHRRRTGE